MNTFFLFAKSLENRQRCRVAMIPFEIQVLVLCETTKFFMHTDQICKTSIAVYVFKVAVWIFTCTVKSLIAKGFLRLNTI